MQMHTKLFPVRRCSHWLAEVVLSLGRTAEAQSGLAAD